MRATALVQKPNGADPTGAVARLTNGRGILTPWNADVSSVSNGRLLFIRQQCLSAGMGLRGWAYNLQLHAGDRVALNCLSRFVER
jgi:hypothetical protein